MNFYGRAIPLTSDGLLRAADCIGVSLAVLMAVIEVETAGCGFLKDGRPVILFERHLFSRRTCSVFDEECPEISSPTPGGYGAGGAHQYERLEKAMSLDTDAALHSCSWGLGQILGMNYARAGYSGVREMVTDFCDSEDAQVFAMARFIVKSGLDDDLRRQDWVSFARFYNGPSFYKSGYDEKLRNAYKKWKGREALDCEMRALQIRLRAQGYYTGKIDGVCGKRTEAARAMAARDSGTIT